MDNDPEPIGAVGEPGTRNVTNALVGTSVPVGRDGVDTGPSDTQSGCPSFHKRRRVGGAGGEHRVIGRLPDLREPPSRRRDKLLRLILSILV